VAFATSRVCVCLHSKKGRWLELSKPNLADKLLMAVALHSLTLGSKGQRSRFIIRLLDVLLLVWVCVSIGLPRFLVLSHDRRARVINAYIVRMIAKQRLSLLYVFKENYILFHC